MNFTFSWADRLAHEDVESIGLLPRAGVRRLPHTLENDRFPFRRGPLNWHDRITLKINEFEENEEHHPPPLRFIQNQLPR